MVVKIKATVIRLCGASSFLPDAVRASIYVLSSSPHCCYRRTPRPVVHILQRYGTPWTATSTLVLRANGSHNPSNCGWVEWGCCVVVSTQIRWNFYLHFCRTLLQLQQTNSRFQISLKSVNKWPNYSDYCFCHDSGCGHLVTDKHFRF